MLLEARAPIDRVYFPTSGIVSMLCLFEDGSVAEMATIGFEGACPTAALLEGTTSPARLVVQIPGSALTIDAAILREAFESQRGVRRLLCCYTQAFTAQLAQSVACNARHSVEARFARWLLTTHDRGAADRNGGGFLLTHHFLADMLGVHRPTVSLIAESFQRAGLIRSQRRMIAVSDRDGLADLACECYRIIREEYERHFPHTWS